jgi:hypothetical protein
MIADRSDYLEGQCQKRAVRCQILLPLPEPEFIERSILPSARGDTWRERYFKLKERLADPIRVMPDELGPLPSGVDPFERCNLWLLYMTLAWGVEKARFVCLWNGGGGDRSRRDRAHVLRSEKANGPGHLAIASCSFVTRSGRSSLARYESHESSRRHS